MSLSIKKYTVENCLGNRGYFKRIIILYGVFTSAGCRLDENGLHTVKTYNPSSTPVCSGNLFAPS